MASTLAMTPNTPFVHEIEQCFSDDFIGLVSQHGRHFVVEIAGDVVLINDPYPLIRFFDDKLVQLGLVREQKGADFARFGNPVLQRRLPGHGVPVVHRIGAVDLHLRHVAVGVEQPAPAGLHDVAHARLAVHRVPVAVVVEARRRVRPGHDRRAQQHVLERLQRTVVDQLLPAAREGLLLLMEMEIDFGETGTIGKSALPNEPIGTLSEYANALLDNV